MASCAVQTAHREYQGAEQALKTAKELGGTSPVLTQAEIDFEKGKVFYGEAEYREAIRQFQKSRKLSEYVVQDRTGPKSTEAISEIAVVQNPAEPAGAPESPVPAPSPAEERTETKAEIEALPVEEKTEVDVAVAPHSLPAQALQKYLERKNKFVEVEKPKSPVKKEIKAKVVEKSKETKNVESATNHSENLTKTQPPTAEEAAAIVKELDTKKMEMTETKTPQETIKETVVKAEAAPGVKTPPKLDEDLRKESEGAIADQNKIEAKNETQRQNLRRSIPGTISFDKNDPSLSSEKIETMSALDQTSVFLLQNPSSTLMLEGYLASGENGTLIDSRYESIRSYLIGKGVPEDQIRLDPERKSGKSAYFLMSVIDH